MCFVMFCFSYVYSLLSRVRVVGVFHFSIFFRLLLFIYFSFADFTCILWFTCFYAFSLLYYFSIIIQRRVFVFLIFCLLFYKWYVLQLLQKQMQLIRCVCGRCACWGHSAAWIWTDSGYSWTAPPCRSRTSGGTLAFSCSCTAFRTIGSRAFLVMKQIYTRNKTNRTSTLYNRYRNKIKKKGVVIKY